ncbi:hypothetical protein [Mucilaginibacter gotjawali]|uniref:Uncharacterized protein n=2 Tax=Mucilaginibacter gotjawali TaxID=1550579 RepID=A0A110B1Z5_9SPHI|nr:hypothetical protein [Mucilaginibacter gotjawali]MBB3055656.1 hypothetical protein [Mucilaginibacter gotjawali]BAU53058.1 hypothetical protein MgSA37_01225 [Mucilaginibacter gotjawali]
MEVEYTLSSGKQTVYVIFAAILTIIAIIFLSLCFRHRSDAPIVLPVAACFVFLAVLLGGQLRKKVTISTESVIATNVLQTKELATADIKGCRIGPKTIVIESVSPTGPKITINNYSDFIDGADLKKWFQQNFKDLDASDLAEEQYRLLNDGRLGATRAEREASITQSKWIGWSYMATGMFVGLMCIPFDRKPGVVIFLIVYPLLGILIMAMNKGLIKFISSTRRSVYSFTALGLFTPAFVLCLTGSLGYNIYDFHNALLPAIVICLATAVLIYITGFNKDMPKAGQAIGMLLISAIYGFGCVVQVNCLFDHSSPQAVHTSVYDKHKNFNKREHYYLTLNPFSPGQEQKETEVSAGTYDKYNTGDHIEVELKKGLLNIPWYYLPDDY